MDFIPRTDSILLTIPEAAKRLGIGRSKLYDLLAAGELESVKIGRCARVPAAELHEYVNRLRMSHRRGKMKPAPRQAGAGSPPAASPLVSLFDEGTCP
jgi:excisionase family DNA binding protein